MKYSVVTIFCIALLPFSKSKQFARLREIHAPVELSDEQLLKLSSLTDTKHIDKVLDNILIPRVVGTANHEKVAKYIIGQLENLDWKVELDEFEENTPNFGKLKFKNIVATLNPNAERYLVLACHYDSKYFENDYFVGASDSAVPCAMMLNLIKVMKGELEQLKEKSDVNLKLIFFDGEEAFLEWGPKDSIYGAKNLAKKYNDNRITLRSTGETVSEIEKIDLLVLLDLLGPPNPTFYSSFRNTDKWYLRLVNLENSLSNLNQLGEHPNAYFIPETSRHFIEDDHIPFLKKQVPILHIIATPFPNSWHTPEDNREGIDMNTVENLNKIFRGFVAEYLHLFVRGTDEDRIPEKEL